jgi:hypothetical protein
MIIRDSPMLDRKDVFAISRLAGFAAIGKHRIAEIRFCGFQLLRRGSVQVGNLIHSEYFLSSGEGRSL